MSDNETIPGTPTEDPNQFPVWYIEPGGGDANRSINGASCGSPGSDGWWDDCSVVDTFIDLFKVVFSLFWRPAVCLIAVVALLDYGPRLLQLVLK